MENIYEFLFTIFVLILVFGALGIGYCAGRKKVCNDIKKQAINCSEEWLNGDSYVISRLNDIDGD